MSAFKEYKKVHRIEKDECDGILEGRCYVFEKIDGANAQLYYDRDSGRVAYGSKNRVIGIGDKLLLSDDFRGFGKWVLQNELQLLKFFKAFPDSIVYGEWLVKHTIKYPNEYMRQFYAFDIRDADVFSEWDLGLWVSWTMPSIRLTKVFENPTIDELKACLELPSDFGAPFREGIVVKNYSFYNRYGRQAYGKILHKDFYEVKSFPKTKINPDDIEVEIARVYCTKARVIKICNKIKMQNTLEKINPQIIYAYDPDADKSKLEMKDIPRVINTTFYDIITEDMFDILKKFNNPTIDFKKLRNLVLTESKKIFIEYLESA